MFLCFRTILKLKQTKQVINDYFLTLVYTKPHENFDFGPHKVPCPLPTPTSTENQGLAPLRSVGKKANIIGAQLKTQLLCRLEHEDQQFQTWLGYSVVKANLGSSSSTRGIGVLKVTSSVIQNLCVTLGLVFGIQLK